MYLTIYRDGTLGLFRHMPDDKEILNNAFGSLTNIYHIQDNNISVEYLAGWLVERKDNEKIKFVHTVV